jgi:hypothetical protein
MRDDGQSLGGGGEGGEEEKENLEKGGIYINIS